ncbi:hypothetical protein B0H12DRAFT_76154 [Mycena haematopus]|nr:hypothetical protein B0H12DRAFT_76154 [Mycena haematopus]
MRARAPNSRRLCVAEDRLCLLRPIASHSDFFFPTQRTHFTDTVGLSFSPANAVLVLLPSATGNVVSVVFATQFLLLRCFSRAPLVL